MERSAGEFSSSKASGHSATRSAGSSRKSEQSGNKSVTSASIDNVFQMLEDEHAKYSQTDSNTSRSAKDSDLDRQIEQEIADIELGSSSTGSRDRGPPGIHAASPPQAAFHQAGPNSHIYPSQTNAATQGESDDDDEEDGEGPVIYANHDDDDDFSQITSSIAGNTLYSHEYMFSSISIPKTKPGVNSRQHHIVNTHPNNRVPSLDGTDSGGGSSRSGGGSPLPSMDEKKTLVMDNDDFERFFGGPSGVATHRRNVNLNRSADETDSPINVYKNSHMIHSHNHMSSHSSVLYDQNDDGITIGDIYSYAPSTMGGDSTLNQVRSSNPLIWAYNQAYSLFNGGQWISNRKKNDDLDSIDEDADYFGTLMSSEFLTSSPQNFPWKKGNKKRKYVRAAFMFGGLFFLGALTRNGDMGNESDLSMKQMNPHASQSPPRVKTETKVQAGAVPEQRQVSALRTPSKKSSNTDRSHEGTRLPAAFDNFAEVTDSPKNTLPFFWHIPRSAGATMNDIFSICYHFRVATNIGISGGHGVDETLQLVDLEGQKFVNVDISTNQGIRRAVNMGFAESDLTDVAISSLLHDSAPLFSPKKKAKMFTMFRHPVDRMVSMFYFMQESVWKAKDTYDKELAEISIENFFLKQLGETNWQVRFLTNQLTKSYVDEEDFKLAKEILRRKVLVGLIINKEESFDRYAKHFGWKNKKPRDLECRKRRLQWDWSLRHPHEVEVLEGNRLWNLISGQNSYDMRLYEYAQELFKEQGEIFQ